MFEVPDQIQNWLPFTMLVFVRLSAMMITMPIFGYSTVAPRIRITIAVILTLIISPIVGENFQTEYTSLAVLVVDIMREIMIGLIIGFGARLIFEVFTLAGGFVSFQMGLAIMNILDPNSGNSAPVIGNFWLMVMITFFVVTDSHHFLLEVIYYNFSAIPLNEAKFDPATGQYIVKAGSLMYELAVRFAAPMMVLMLLADVAIAFAARVMPQLNIFFISLPMKIGVGLFMVLISLKIFQTMFGYIYNNFEGLTLDIITAVKG
ncbi:MAG: flagellar biosynthetic protein FliR [Calditrichaeota bacterium]|nr:MAG: flagellar biosynthetic protein FliR [Calditrichota bacterium]MBL1204020.1 flagellar biosynthetic protein FliR [Calditrichota bacterium]NOG43851.1 flagellar biosynthetic protein FliR [Calditrichota bacterium]